MPVSDDDNNENLMIAITIRAMINVQDSKRAFLHNIVNEEGEKGKLECFVNFCEDTIFEVRFAAPPQSFVAFALRLLFKTKSLNY